MINCAWCQKREAEFELVAYFLHKDTSHLTSKSAGKESQLQYLRGALYVKVKICKSCLPVVKESDVMLGRGAKKPTNV